jgi:hypothetical protein
VLVRPMENRPGPALKVGSPSEFRHPAQIRNSPGQCQIYKTRRHLFCGRFEFRSPSLGPPLVARAREHAFISARPCFRVF